MGTEEQQISFKVLQDTVGDLSKRVLRSEEASNFLEKRVRELEKRLAGKAPLQASPPASPKAARQQREPGREQEKDPVEPDAQRFDIAPEGEGGPGDEVRSGELDLEEQDIPLEGSIWCAALFVGSPGLGRWGSVWLLLCIAINVTVQVIFCIVVAANFLEQEFSQEELDGLDAWRLRIAHDHRFVGAEGLSLGSRVCGMDPTLELSTEQAVKVSLIRNYIPSLDPDLSEDPFSMDRIKAIFDGSIMCILALTCWTLTVLKEIMSTFDLLGATFRLPPANGPGMHVTKAEGGSIQVTSMGWGSKAFMVGVSVLRLGISGLLLAMGCMYLCFISSMQDLLLNAVALEFVMMIDELVFEALAPRRARQIMARVEPLKLPPWRKFKALDTKGVSVLVTLVICLLLFWTGPLEEHMQNLRTAHTLMCGGHMDFAVVTDSFGMVHMESMRHFNPDTQYTNLDRPWDRAVRENIHRKSTPEYTLSPQSYSFSSIDEVKMATMASTTQGIYSLRFLGCHDALDMTVTISPNVTGNWQYWPLFVAQRRVWLNYLKFITKGKGGSSCWDYHHLCHTEQIMSAICPTTCGCDSLTFGRYDHGLRDGCPGVCLSGLSQQESRSTPCEDVRTGDESDPKWLTLLSWAAWVGHPVSQLVAKYGCAGITAAHFDVYLCQAPTSWSVDNSPFRTAFTQTDPFSMKLFTYLCPLTCNCGGLGGRYSARFSDPPIQPPDNVCPDKCICPWPYGTRPPQRVVNCTVQHYVPGVFLETVQADAQCCYLMQEHSRGLKLFALGMSSGRELQTISDTLCRPCRSPCLEQLRTLRVLGAGNRTYPEDFLWTTYGEGAPNQSRWRYHNQCA